MDFRQAAANLVGRWSCKPTGPDIDAAEAALRDAHAEGVAEGANAERSLHSVRTDHDVADAYQRGVAEGAAQEREACADYLDSLVAPLSGIGGASGAIAAAAQFVRSGHCRARGEGKVKP